jgi:outer membrane protein
MKHITLLFIISLFLFTNNVLVAQNTWTLERCIHYALENNLDVRRQHLQQDRAGHDLTQSYAYLAPTLDAGSRLGVNYGRSIDAVTNEFFTERIASQSLSATSNLTLFAGFRTINNIRYNLARQTAFKYDTEKLENDLILTIANAYLQILYFEDMLEVASEQLEVSQQQVERTRILLEGGTVSRRDLLEMEAAAAEQEVIYTKAENNLNLSYLELIHLLELDPEMDFSIERPSIQVEEVQVIVDPDNVLEKAGNTEPSLTAARHRITMAERNLAIANGERIPTLSLNTSLGSRYSEAFKRVLNNDQGKTSPVMYNLGLIPPKDSETPLVETVPYRDQITENYYRSAFLTLNIPIFNRFQTRTRIQHARIDLDQARISYEQNRNDLSRVIHQAYADATAAYKEYYSNSKALEAGKESFTYAEEGFTLGRVSPLEYNEAKARLHRAEVNVLQSMYEFVFKVKILEFYQGEGFEL